MMSSCLTMTTVRQSAHGVHLVNPDGPGGDEAPVPIAACHSPTAFLTSALSPYAAMSVWMSADCDMRLAFASALKASPVLTRMLFIGSLWPLRDVLSS